MDITLPIRSVEQNLGPNCTRVSTNRHTFFLRRTGGAEAPTGELY